MQAIILAAGKGRRLVKYTYDKPKALVPIKDKPLLKYILDNLIANKITKIILVIGYKGNLIKNFVLNEYKNKANFIFIENNEFNTTNNIYSLYLARDYFNEDTILIECDILFNKEALSKLLEESSPNAALISPYQPGMDGTAVTLDLKGYINEFIDGANIDWSTREKFYKTVNIYKFSKDFLKKIYLPFLETYIKVTGKQAYYESVLKVILNLKNTISLKGVIIPNAWWMEIDTPDDKLQAEIKVSLNFEDLEKSYFGGLWRFPDIKDFLFVINPFFPPKKLMSELQNNIELLTKNYPSKLDIFSKLLSPILNISEDFIVAGNGASELIRFLTEILPSPKGAIVPTFEEYVKYSDFFLKKFNYTTADIFPFLKGSKIKTLFLVNPNNPTGFLLDKTQLMDLLNFTYKNNIYLVLDESFIDFSDTYTSLLNEEILKEYPNLILIKSLSKNWGIPGLRLGFIATANTKIITNIKNLLPIWNINSLAEYFLKIFLKYKKNYEQSLDLIRLERRFLISSLREIKYFKVFDSSANFIFIENKSKIPTEELTQLLLREYKILIKHITSRKKGIPNNNFIRIGIRNRQDNLLLLKALREIFTKFIA